jgi:purine-cytosine permease-like protein
MAKEWHWYDDAIMWAWLAALVIGGELGFPCIIGPAYCIMPVALAALGVVSALTVCLVYLIATFRYRPEASVSPRDSQIDTKTR